MTLKRKKKAFGSCSTSLMGTKPTKNLLPHTLYSDIFFLQYLASDPDPFTMSHLKLDPLDHQNFSMETLKSRWD